MKAAIEAIRNKEMGSCKASRVFNVPQTTLERYVTDRQTSSSETVKIELGRKQVPPCEAENDLAEHCLLMERKFFGLTMADLMRLAYKLAVRNGIKNQFWREMKRLEGSGWKISYVVIYKFQLERLKVSLSRARGSPPESVAQFFKSTNLQWTPLNIILQYFTIAMKPASLLYNTNTRKY